MHVGGDYHSVLGADMTFEAEPRIQPPPRSETPHRRSLRRGAGTVRELKRAKDPDDPGSFQAYAFGYGYIKGLIQAVNSEG
jgi:hypothetical protein